MIDQRVLQSEELLQRLNEAKASVDESLSISYPEHRVEAYLQLMKRGGKPDLHDIILDCEKLFRLQDVAVLDSVVDLLTNNQLQQAILEIKKLHRRELDDIVLQIESLILAEELNRSLLDALRTHYVKQMTYGIGKHGLIR